jgi:hypothetical protein
VFGIGEADEDDDNKGVRMKMSGWARSTLRDGHIVVTPRGADTEPWERMTYISPWTCSFSSLSSLQYSTIL